MFGFLLWHSNPTSQTRMHHRDHRCFPTQVLGAVTGVDAEVTLLFGSTAGVWSQSGAAHYAAANSFLRARASHRVVTLSFGPFSGAGMAASMR